MSSKWITGGTDTGINVHFDYKIRYNPGLEQLINKFVRVIKNHVNVKWYITGQFLRNWIASIKDSTIKFDTEKQTSLDVIVTCYKYAIPTLKNELSQSGLLLISSGNSCWITDKDDNSSLNAIYVSFADNLLEDFKNKFFVIDGLYFDQERKYIRDFKDGLGDFYRRSITINTENVIDAFKAEPILILEYFRLFSWLNGSSELERLIDKRTGDAIKSLAGKITFDFQDAYYNLMQGIKNCKNTYSYINNLRRYNLLPSLFPGLSFRMDFADVHLMIKCKNLSVILAYFLRKEDPNLVYKILKKIYKYPTIFCEEVKLLILVFMWRSDPQNAKLLHALLLKKRELIFHRNISVEFRKNKIKTILEEFGYLIKSSGLITELLISHTKTISGNDPEISKLPYRSRCRAIANKEYATFHHQLSKKCEVGIG